MLVYSLLHLSGYDLTLDDLKSFRQWGSRTPGHPERDKVHVTPGVEITTGPLGQGFANGVGMAIAERFLRGKFGPEVMDHRTFVICSDGDLQEGIASEAASLAGHLRLGRMVYLYDNNHIQLDGPTRESYTEDVVKRFDAYGWHTQTVDDANDLDALRRAIDAGIAEENAPSLISVRSIIGWPSPNKQGSQKAHGSPLGEDEVRLTKEVMGWDPDKQFYVPDGVYDHFSQVDRGGELQAAWEERFAAWKGAHGELAAEWEAAWSSPARPMPGLAEALPTWKVGDDAIATRSAGQKVMAAFERFTPTMIGGAADLSESTKTEFPESKTFTDEDPGRNIKFGVREHGMGGAVNGMAGHGGILRPYGSTFGQFSDYMRGSVRLSALMDLEVAWVYTHDSIGLGEDGPTHQPVEHFAALRAIPGMHLFRPGDANETAYAWRLVLEELEGPAAFMLSRQNLPILEGVTWEGVRQRRLRAAGRRRRRCAGRARRHRLGAAAVRRRARGAAGRGHPGARGVAALLGGVRRPGRRLPRRGAAGRRAQAVGRGGRGDGLAQVGRRVGLAGALRRLRAGRHPVPGVRLHGGERRQARQGADRGDRRARRAARGVAAALHAAGLSAADERGPAAVPDARGHP